MMVWKYLMSMLVGVIVLIAGPATAQERGTITDPRDGHEYNWVRMGSQVWMAENLSYASPGSGYFDLKKYGRLYDWEAANESCPRGWHLPSDEEWMTLEKFLGISLRELNKEQRDRGTGSAGVKLKSSAGWEYYMQNGNGSDLFGFHGLPGGYYQTHSKRFMLYGSSATFWTSSLTADGESAITRELGSNYNGIDRGDMYTVHGASCRCVRD